MNEKLESAMPWMFVAGLLLAWQLACVGFNIPNFLLPRPSVVVQAFMAQFNPIMENSWDTLARTVIGFILAVILGALLGIAIGSSRLIYRGLYPVLIGFNSVPKVAVVPIFVIWFGTGAVPAVLTAFLVSFFPIAVNVATGLATVEPELLDVLRSLGARKRQILIKIGLPRSLPYFFASLKIAITLAFVGTIISETVAEQQRHRLPDDGSDRKFRHAIGVCRPVRDRGHGYRHVRDLRRRRTTHDVLGEARRRNDDGMKS